MSHNPSIEIYPADIQHIPRHIATTQSILLGGPCTGKTEICQSFESIEYVNTVDGLEHIDTDNPVILDNAYQILSDHRLDTSEYIATLENHTPGICYVFRPYELEWVISQSPSINFDFDSVQLLRLVYSQSDAIAMLQRIDDSPPAIQGRSFVEELEYEFSFVNAPIDDYHSYLPYCPVRASNAAVENVLTGESVRAKLKDFSDRSDLSAFARSASEQIPDSAATTLSSVVGGGVMASGVGTVALFAVLPFLISRTLDDEHEFEQNLSRVLGNELFPHHQERLERESEIPPRTFETLGELSDPVTAHRLDEIFEQQEELRTVLQEVEISTGDEIASLAELADQLATETIPITEMVSKEFNDAILGPDALTQRREDRITEELKEVTSISEAEAKDRVDELFSSPLREEKLNEDFTNKAPEQGALLVHGEVGGGTKLFCRGLLKQYAREDYDIGVINTTTPEILRPRLRSMQTNSESLALVYSVGRERSISPHNFQILFGEQVFDLYDVIIIECSHEQVDSIRSAWDQTRDISHDSAKSRLEPKAEIQLSSIDDETLEQIPRTLSSHDSETIKRIADTADGNPTVAVEATLETLERGIESISEIRGRDLIRDRLDGMLEELRENHGEEPVEIFVMISAIRGVDDQEELANLLDISERRVQIYLNNPLSGYTYERADGTIIISPRIYALTIFEMKWFNKIGDEWLPSDWKEKYTERIRDSDSSNIVGLATNLAELQATELNTSSAPDNTSIILCLENLLKESGVSTFPQILTATGVYQTPIHLAVLTDSKPLHQSLNAVFKTSNDDSLDVVNQYLPLFMTGLAGVTAAAYHHDNRSPEAFLMYGTNLFREIVGQVHGHPELANLITIRYYSTVLSPLLRDFDLSDVKPFVKEVTGRAAGIQNSSDVNDVFLVEFYSQIIAPHVEFDNKPGDYGEWIDFIVKEIIEANEQPEGLTGLDMPSDELIVGESRQFKTSPDRVVVQVFARAIITNPPQDPTDRLQWIEDIETRLKQFRTRLDEQGDGPTEYADEDEVVMSLPLWASILGQLADFHSPDWANEWVAIAEQQLSEEFDTMRDSAPTQRASTNQTDKPDHDGWARFVGEVIFEKRDIAEPGEWTERLVELTRDQAREARYSSLIELRSYAWMLCRAVQSHFDREDEEITTTWVQWYFDHAAEPAESDVIELKHNVALAEPFVIAPECFEVDQQNYFVSAILNQLDAEAEDPQYAVVGGCARILMQNNVPVNELFEWVYEIICCFSLQQDTDNFDLSIVSLYSKIIIYILDFQNESLARRVAEGVLPQLSEREGTEAIFDIIVLIMRDLVQVPFEEFGNGAEHIICLATATLSETEREEIRNNLPNLLESEYDSEYIDEWIEGLMRWTHS